MFIDASALVSILLQEEDGPMLEGRVVATEGVRYVSSIVRFEATLAVAGALSTLPHFSGSAKAELISKARSLVSDYLDEIDARDIVIDDTVGRAALDAAATYGKAVGHKADLNIGDCFSYACATIHGLPMLYKGNDFSETDLA